MLKRLLLPLIVIIVGLSAWTIAQDKQTVVVGPSILKTLPKNTTLVLHAPSLASIVRDFKNSPIYKLKDKQEFTELLAQAEQSLEEVRQTVIAETQIDPIEMLGAVKGEAVLAVGDISKVIKSLGEALMNMEEPELDSESMPLLIGVDALGGREKFKKNILSLMALAVREGAGVKTEDFHGGKITTLSPPEGAEDGPERIYIGEKGSKFFLAFSRKFLEQTIVKLSEANPEDSLENDPGFKETAGRLGKGNHASFFMNMKPILKAVNGAMEGNPFVFLWQTVEKVLFGTSLNNFGMAIALEENGIRSKSFVHNNGASDGMLGWFKSKPFAASPPSIVPGDAGTYSVFGLNAEAITKSVKMMLNLVQSFAALQGAEANVEEMFEAEMGFKLSSLLSSIGNRAHNFGSGRVGGVENPLGDMTIVLELSNDAPWKKLVNKAIEMSGGAFEPKKYMGRDVFVMGDGFSGPQPAVCISDKMVIFGSEPENVQKVIRRIGKDSPGLADNAEFKKALSRLPAQVTGLAYQSSSVAAGYMEVIEQALQFSPAGDAVPPEAMRALNALLNLMGTSASYTTWTEKGLYAESTTLFKK
ncbi:MAG: hypothetical protein VX387_10340 [Planctomycetota bacterium]|nr:hypothetical protein [Planctomycetota bacterium]